MTRLDCWLGWGGSKTDKDGEKKNYFVYFGILLILILINYENLPENKTSDS